MVSSELPSWVRNEGFADLRLTFPEVVFSPGYDVTGSDVIVPGDNPGSCDIAASVLSSEVSTVLNIPG